MDASTGPRVTLIHDWLTGMRGGEKCLEVLCREYPEATLYSLLHRKGSVSEAIERLNPKTSFLNRIPGIFRYYRYALPLMPRAVRRWEMSPCDLMVSFSHCVAKSVKPPEGTPHVSYCFTPMRYAWHMREAYFGEGRASGIKGRLIRYLLGRLREWDRETASHVSHFVAISRTIQQRIRECYDRDSVVIYPPVDTDFYHLAPVPREDFYLIVSAFAPYKRVDLAVEACRKLKRKLIVIGTGQDERRLHELAGGAVEFLGWQPDAVIRAHLQRCRALLFPGEEDFGIVPVEAMACGAPVVAYGRGGATETVSPLRQSAAPTGLWFEEQSVDCLAEALEWFERERDRFSPQAARRQAERFNKERFRRELLSYLDEARLPTRERRAA